MKGAALIALVLLIATGVLGFLGFTYLNQNQQSLRDRAVDGCMQNAVYTQQQPNPQSSELMDTFQEPHRFWYKTCMEEKGYSVRVEL